MDRYIALITVNDEKLDAVFTRLREAEETIRDCYEELREMGVITVTKKENADRGN